MTNRTAPEQIFPHFRLSSGDTVLSRGPLYYGCKLPLLVSQYGSAHDLDCMVFSPSSESRAELLFSVRLKGDCAVGKFYPSATKFQCLAEELVTFILLTRENIRTKGNSYAGDRVAFGRRLLGFNRD